MKRIALIILMVILSSCSTVSVDNSAVHLTKIEALETYDQAVDAEVIKALWTFSDKHQVLDLSSNDVYSPTSLYAALSMLLPATSHNTYTELSDYLSLTDKALLTPLFNSLNVKNDEFANFLTNSVWLSNQFDDFDQEIIEELKEIYLTSSHAVDFTDTNETGKLITDFVNDQTEGFIDNLEIEPNRSTTVLLLNTLYFKDRWVSEFYEDESINFNGQGLVDTIGSMIESPLYYEDDLGQMVSKPFKNGNKMLFIRPKKSLQEIWSYSQIHDFLINSEPQFNTSVILRMAEIEVQSKHEYLKELLSESGLSDVMSNYPSLSFHENRDDGQAITSVIQEAKIKVDKEGAEAAAYTSIEVRETAMPVPETIIEMDLDVPYLMILLSKDNAPLFVVSINEIP